MGIFGLIKPQSNALVLSNYPELFKKDVMIIVGSNASQIELGTAEAIATNLKELAGNEPITKTDSEVSENDESDYNLILVGTPNSNSLLQEVYSATNATRVTAEYPGENKGVLQILRNPWNSDKALLLVAGSDEWGVKAGSETLTDSEEIEGLGGTIAMTEFIKEQDTNEGWIIGGTRTSSILVKPSKTTLCTGEDFVIAIKAWTFAPGQILDYDDYFRVYATSNPNIALDEKKMHVHTEEGTSYARVAPFRWTITAPMEVGNCTYRIVEEGNKQPSFESYDMAVEFDIVVKEAK